MLESEAFASFKLFRIIPRQHAVISALPAGYYDLLEMWEMDIAVQWNHTVIAVVISLHSCCFSTQTLHSHCFHFLKAHKAKGKEKAHHKIPGV